MAATPSSMVELGTPAPDFALPDLNGQERTLADFTGRALLVAFTCNHCPFVKHVEEVFGRVVSGVEGLDVVAICSNDAVDVPDDGPEGLADQAKRAGWDFPYLIDASQETAKAYHAACTPDFFLYDADRKLAYRGQFDDSRPGNDVPVTGNDLSAAIDAVLNGEVPEDQKPSIGCNIKWKS
ncbi:thioredoxin family protein [Salininema proteolyticum]|uniref:Thioredoxin family protein n=1 Tax=Salininema proteolyticum TaxID=1607685 RepID=A0ABV8U3E1_9ACTN